MTSVEEILSKLELTKREPLAPDALRALGFSDRTVEILARVGAQEIAGEVLQDGHRRPDNACASILDSQLAYDGTLHTARIHVWVARLNDAIASGDVAERERIKEKLAELRRAGEDLRERLKKEVGR